MVVHMHECTSLLADCVAAMGLDGAAAWAAVSVEPTRRYPLVAAEVALLIDDAVNGSVVCKTMSAGASSTAGGARPA